MNGQRLLHRAIAAILLSAVLLTAMCGVGISETTTFNSLSDLNREGIIIGAMEDGDLYAIVQQTFPKATVRPLTNLMSLNSLLSGKLDASVLCEEFINGVIADGESAALRAVGDPVYTFQVALGLPEDEPFEGFNAQINASLQRMLDDGTLAEMNQRWLVDYVEDAPEIAPPENPVYTLRVATHGQYKPFSYYKDGRLTGHSVELAERVAADLNCAIEWELCDFPAMLAGLTAGVYDMVSCDLFVREEAKSSVTFSIPYRESNIRAYVLDGAAPDAAKTYKSIDDLDENTVFGNVTGSVYGDIIKERYPGARVIEFNACSDVLEALAAGKIDAFPYDEPMCRYIESSRSEFRQLEELLSREDYYFLTGKSDAGIALAEDFNAWVAEARSKGILDEMKEFWCGTESPEGRVVTDDLTGENGKLRVGLSSSVGRPATLLYNGEQTGYCTELVVRYCRDRGYDIEFLDLDLSAFAAAVISGKIDIYADMVSYTDERAEAMTYTDSIYSGGVGILVRNNSAATGGSFWDNMVSGFDKTFIREARWRLILQGLGATLLITIGGFALANVMGALFCAMEMSERRWLRVIADIYSRIMQGTPMVVILMILYYVIFGKASISGLAVAIIGFGIVDGATLAQQFTGAISAVDKGQREAALALGFTRFEVFTGIVIPQAARSALPGYFSELIALMKGTAIVGYIAVIDLTKASDIIRSSTYEAFFPLIAIAAIYFAIACLLLSLMKHILRRLAPKRRTGKEAAK